MVNGINKKCVGLYAKAQAKMASAAASARQKEKQGGQGTAEYAVLIGIVVVAAVVLVVAFGDQLKSVWQNAITEMSSVVTYTHTGAAGTGLS